MILSSTQLSYWSCDQAENHNISELKSKVTEIRFNADEMQKKLALILQELDKYNGEVKVYWGHPILKFIVHVHMPTHFSKVLDTLYL